MNWDTVVAAMMGGLIVGVGCWARIAGLDQLRREETARKMLAEGKLFDARRDLERERSLRQEVVGWLHRWDGREGVRTQRDGDRVRVKVKKGWREEGDVDVVVVDEPDTPGCVPYLVRADEVDWEGADRPTDRP